ncbi:hypothetical protein [Photobacterium sp. R1]
MSDTFFFIWVIFQLLLILYVNHKRKSIINAYTLATLVYFGSYAYPYLYVLGYTDTLFNESIFYSDYASSAIWSYFLFKCTFDVVYILQLNLWRKNRSQTLNNHLILKNEKIVKFYRRFNSTHICVLYVISLFLFIVGAGGLEEFIFPKTRFEFDNEKIVNLAYIISLLTLFYSLLRHYNYQQNHILIFCGLCYVLVYPMSLSGRAVVLPFVMIVIASYFSERGLSKLKLLLLTFFISAFYINALYVRNNGIGIDNFILGFGKTYSDIPLIFDFFFATVSGFATTTLTHAGLADGTINIKPDPLLFLLYISPIPSFILPTELFVPYQSLTPHFGFSIGINSDIVSESILWFGSYGMLLVGGIIGWIANFVDVRALSKDIIAKLLFFSFTYLTLMSNIASMRASSRFIIIFMTLIFLKWMLVKLTKSTKGL